MAKDKKINMDKLYLVNKILSIENEKIVSEIKHMVDYLTNSGDTTRIDVKQYNKEIEDAINRVRSGKFVSHDDVMDEIDGLFNDKLKGL